MPPERYWRDRLRLTVTLLVVWFLVGPVLGILLIRPLNALELFGLPLGFWVAQQGAIYVFIALIFVYAVLADRADRAVRRAEPTAANGGSGVPGL